MKILFFMIYFLLYYTSLNFINTTSDGVYDLLLHIKPTECYEIEVDGGTETFFSDFTKSKGISLEVEKSDNSVLGPFDYTSHISGINFQRLYDDKISSYKLKIYNEDQEDIKLAMIFLDGDYHRPLKLFDFLYSSLKFPYSYSQSKKYVFYIDKGIVFYEKSYSLTFLFVSAGIIIFQFFVIICCCCQK